MEIYRGKSVSNSIAIGRIFVYRKRAPAAGRREAVSAETELARLSSAVRTAAEELSRLYEKTLREIGQTDAAILATQRMILLDPEYQAAVERIVREQAVNAEYAVAEAERQFLRMFASMEDEFIASRGADVKDVSERLLRILSGETLAPAPAGPVILAAEDLAPSETVQLSRDGVLAFVTVQGSVNSHTAILARTMSVPALVSTPIPLDERIDGRLGIVDGSAGVFYVDPDPETLSAMGRKRQALQEETEQYRELCGKESVTLDGQRVRLCANVGNIADLPAAIHNDAEGIGLFRSEFLYLERESCPTEEEQFAVYRQAAEAMPGKRVVIRTLDVGSDKQCPYFEMEEEASPALGCRGIRFSLSRPEIFRTQLRAICRASACGRIAILYPMITSVEEIRAAKRITEQVKRELRESGIPCGDPEQGIMIETPAAALISDLLAGEVDFFSIGTNDLTQYALAIDRQNMRLERFYDAHHPAILRMIALVAENARRAGIPVAICGELGADETLTREFLAMGVEELSVAPASILPIRRQVREAKLSAYTRMTI